LLDIGNFLKPTEEERESPLSHTQHNVLDSIYGEGESMHGIMEEMESSGRKYLRILTAAEQQGGLLYLP